MKLALLVAVVTIFVLFVSFRRKVPIKPMPTPGMAAPDFTLKSQESKPVSLKDFRGKWVVLYFYPKDQTPGCTIEARNFQHDLPKYDVRNAVVLGVSVQDTDSHKSFCAKEGLGFRLLADPDRTTSAAYGSLADLLVTTISSRHTFLIDPEGKIAKVYDTVSVGSHSQQVLADLDALQQALVEKRQ